MSWLKRIGARLLLVSASLVLGLAITEGFLRVFLPMPFTAEYVRPDDKLYRVPRENFSATLTTDHTFTIETNSLGLRTAREVDPKHDGVGRVLVIGDSYTFGTGVSNGQTYPDYLERILNSEPTVLDVAPARYGCRPLQSDRVSPSGPPRPHPVAADPVAVLSRELFTESLTDLYEILAEYRQVANQEVPLVYTIARDDGPLYEFIESRARREEATRERVSFVDTARTFRWVTPGSEAPDQLVIDCYNLHAAAHWSPEGNALVAWELAQAIDKLVGTFSRVEVLNAGMFGWGSIQYGIRLRQLIATVQSDLVVVMFCTNDLRDNIEYVTRPSLVVGTALDRSVRYAWKAEAIQGNGLSAGETGWIEFEIGRVGSDKPATWMSPDAPAALEPIGQVSDVAPVFRWTPVAGASTYQFTLAARRADGRMSVMMVVRTTESSYRLSSRLWAKARETLRSMQVVRRVFFAYRAWLAARLERQINS